MKLVASYGDIKLFVCSQIFCRQHFLPGYFHLSAKLYDHEGICHDEHVPDSDFQQDSIRR